MAGFPQAGARRHCTAGKRAGETTRRRSADSELVWRLRSGRGYWRAAHSNLEGGKKQNTKMQTGSPELTRQSWKSRMAEFLINIT